jgi:glycosyltransferase involved in cell wall biosynthesis
LSKKLLFIRAWSKPPTGASVSRLLASIFPELTVETIDIVPLIKAHREVLAKNTLETIKAYSVPILLRKGGFKLFFWGTPYIFRAVNDMVRNRVPNGRGELIFTFQLQSLFDTSLDGIPHFVYTGNTMLAHLNYPDLDRSSLYLPSWIELERTIYQNAACIFTRSQNVSTSLIEQYRCPPEKVLCVYAGGNTTLVAGDLDNRGYRNRNILFVGNDWKRKGGPVLVEAFMKVLQVEPDAHLTIVGCTPNIVHPQIKIVGYVPVQAVYKYFKHASIFCMPTLWEPFDVVFVEALSYRLPIVTTSVGATADFVKEGENGYLVTPNDAEGLAQALLKLIRDPQLCRTFGDKSYQLATERYNWQSVGSAIRARVLSALEAVF